jgi:1,4-dihydroxy-2-naphthoate polyprenyltransferase
MAGLRSYYRALRAFSFPASALPSITGSVIAWRVLQSSYLNPVSSASFSWFHAFLALIGCVAIHSVSNLINDLYDYKSGLDSAENFGMKNPLVNGSLTIQQIKTEIYILFILALAIGCYFIYQIGLPIIILVLIGIFSAWAYTAPPFKLKYRGLGDLQALISFGILMTIGSYCIQPFVSLSGNSLVTVFLLSLPQGLLISAILHANNHRDRDHDIQSSAFTIATRLSYQWSVRYQYILVLGAYLILGVCMALQIVPILCLSVVLSIPYSRKVLQNITKREQAGTLAHRLLVADSARLQLVFGLLMVLGLLLG